MSQVAEADDLLVAELAFRLLDFKEEAAVRERVTTDPALAARLASWNTLAATLLLGGSEPPRPSLWQEIEARLPGNDDGRDGPVSAAGWRAASIALGVLAAVLGALALRPAAPVTVPTKVAQPGGAPLVAVLRGPHAPGTVAVTFEPGSDRLTLVADAVDAHAGSVELWAIAGGGAPQSLGLIPVDAPRSRTLDDASRLISPGITLAVTLEPRGGSPTGAPSSAPILTGIVRRAPTHGA